MAQGNFYNQVDWYNVYEYTISAGQRQAINSYGRFITLLENSVSTGPTLSINKQRGGELPAGISVELPSLERFNSIDLVNETGSPQTVKVVISNGQIYDSRFVASAAIPVKSGGALTSSVATVTNGAAAAIASAADTNKKEVIIQNNDAVNEVWVGGADVDPATAKGTKVAAGGTAILTTSAAVYAKNASGADVDISINVIGD